MAEFAGAFAASHAPLIARDWDRLTPALREQMTAAFGELGRRLTAARADVLIAIGTDHWTNFFIDNLPTVCVGVGVEHDGPREPFMATFAHKTLPGDAAFGSHLLERALDEGFEPSSSHRLTLDHGFCIPLWKMGLEPLPAIVPIMINELGPPMLSIARCATWGRFLARAIAAYPSDVRVALLATGGLSHSIGEPTMGHIDEVYDRECIEHFAAGDTDALVAFLDRTLATAGNGSHEIRNWVVAHAAAGGRRFDLIDYTAAADVYVGCAWATWNAAA